MGLSRAHQKCVIDSTVEPDVRDGNKHRWTSLCGRHLYDGWPGHTDVLAEVSCPKCAKKYGKQKLKQMARAGLKVSEERVELGPRDYDAKSRYAIAINGEPVGHIDSLRGWGAGWMLFDLTGKKVETRGIRTERAAKEQIMAEAPLLLEEGKLKTRATLDTERRQREAEFEEERRKIRELREEADQRRREKEARKLEILEGLKEIREQLSGQLSNFQTDALEGAIDLLSPRAPRGHNNKGQETDQ